MSYRLAGQRLASVTATPAIPRIALAQAQRYQSTVADPKAKASSLIDSLPGNSVVSKTGWITAGVAASGYAISKELYVLNEEVVILGGFLIFAGYVGSIIRAPYKEWADSNINKIRDILNSARANHTDAVKERIESVGQLKDSVALTEALFSISKETAKLEHENFELRQRADLAAEVKSTLDSWVRYEAQAREGEQQKLVQHVIDKVNKDIQDPKFQKDVLADAVTQVEELVKKKAI